MTGAPLRDSPPDMRRLLLPALLAALAPGALAQTVTVDTVVTRRTVVDTVRAGRGGAIPPTPRRSTTLLLPQDRGVFYVRYGEPGGLRVRSRNGRPVTGARPAPAAGATTTVLQPIVVPGGPGGVVRDGITRRDLDRLEDELIDAIDDRLDALRDADRFDRPYVPPARTPLAPPRPGAQPEAPRPARPGEDVVTVQEVERALLDTGLFRTSRVNFEFGKATLIPVSRDILRTISDVLDRYPNLRIQVAGHTDNVSSDAFNLRLSRDRAQTVVDYLVGSGIDADRLESVGYGERRPIASNDTETGRALNRRVEFTVLNPEAAETIRRSTTSETDGPDSDRVRQILREELERLRREDGDN